jgi:glutamine amidotransferase
MGNLHSITRCIQRIQPKCSVKSTNDPSELQSSDRIILPGVGHFGRAMEMMHQLGVIEALNEFVANKQRPILGICLGMQLLTDRSEEGDARGLGWIKGTTKRFDTNNQIHCKIPHTGWNTISQKKDVPLLQDVSPMDEFYFVHGYHVELDSTAEAWGWTDYGYPFPSVIGSDNIMGTQFHPEKSHFSGATILNNFLRI